MPPDRQQFIERLIATVAFIQDVSGEKPSEITGGTVPIGALRGFDSLRGVETTTYLAQELGIEPKTRKGECLNLFVSSDGRRALSLAETADRLIAILS